MAEIQIAAQRCTGCGSCVRDCMRDLLYLEASKAKVKEDGLCIQCGHCVAVCPADAVRLAGCPEGEILPYDPAEFDIPGEHLLHFMKFRRSVRQFQARPVEEEKLALLLEGARYAPTGGNLQNTRYILLDEKKNELTDLTLKTLYDAAERIGSDPALRGMERYRERWRGMYLQWKEQGRESLFYNAPCVLMAVSRYPRGGTGRLDAGLASANVELLAHALGLGVCYVGFFTIAAALEPELYRRLGVSPKEEVVSTMAIGHPAVQYHRTVNRKPANLTRL